MSANKKEKRQSKAGHTTLVNECAEDAMVQWCQLCLPTVVKYSDSTTGSCGEAVTHTTHTGISLITCCPSGLLYTCSPFHFLPQHSNDTRERQRLQRTQHSVGRAQVGPKWACKCKSTLSLTTQTIGTWFWICFPKTRICKHERHVYIF